MLLEFTVGNFYSIKEEISLSMIASSDDTYDEINTFNVEDGISALRTSVIYGANGSGKSNFLKAIKFFQSFIKNSSKKYTIGDNIPVMPFRFNTDNAEKPSLFEIIFHENGKRYRYGFEVDQEKVVSEWLYVKFTSRESLMFYREQENPIEIGSKYRGIKKYLNKHKNVRENALFLSVLVQNGDEGEAKEVAKYVNNITVISGLMGSHNGKTIELLNIDKYHDEKEEIINIMKSVDFGLDSLSLDFHELDVSEKNEIIDTFPDELRKIIEKNMGKGIEFGPIKEIEINSHHKIFNGDNKFIGFETLKIEEESDGTKRFFQLIGPVIDSIKNGKVLFIDEMESNLHLFILETIIKLFQNKCVNSDSQLVFSTHNISLLSSELFRRDQIWLMEKDIYGASTLNSLVEYKLRKDVSFEKNYRMGKFGAIPMIHEKCIGDDSNE